ncbi:hypothetical protein ACHAPX_007515 [Trichoderma viride]
MAISTDKMAPAEIVPKDCLGLINDKTEGEWTPPTPIMENTEYDGQNVQRWKAQTVHKQVVGEQDVKNYQKRLAAVEAEKVKTKNTPDTNPATPR